MKLDYTKHKKGKVWGSNTNKVMEMDKPEMTCVRWCYGDARMELV